MFSIKLKDMEEHGEYKDKDYNVCFVIERLKCVMSNIENEIPKEKQAEKLKELINLVSKFESVEEIAKKFVEMEKNGMLEKIEKYAAGDYSSMNDKSNEEYENGEMEDEAESSMDNEYKKTDKELNDLFV